MQLRNLIFYRFPKSIVFNANLTGGISNNMLKPVGPMELQSVGFIPPLGEHAPDRQIVSLDCVFWITVGTETRLLPASVLNRELQAKIETFEKVNGRKPSGKTRRQMKEDLVMDLLPRAFVKPGRVDAFIDPKRGLIAVNASSRRTGDMVVAQVREALGRFPALPLHTDTPMRATLTAWLRVNGTTFNVGDELELRDPADSGSAVKVQRTELAGEEITTHLEAGRQVTRLALELDGNASFVLGEDLQLRKFRLLDGAVEQIEARNDSPDDIVSALEASALIWIDTLHKVFDALDAELKFSEAA